MPRAAPSVYARVQTPISGPVVGSFALWLRVKKVLCCVCVFCVCVFLFVCLFVCVYLFVCLFTCLIVLVLVFTVPIWIPGLAGRQLGLGTL